MHLTYEVKCMRSREVFTLMHRFFRVEMQSHYERNKEHFSELVLNGKCYIEGSKVIFQNEVKKIMRLVLICW